MIKWKNSVDDRWNCRHVNKNDVLIDCNNDLFIYNTDYEGPKGYFKWIMMKDLYELLETAVKSKRPFTECNCNPNTKDSHE